MSTTVLLALTSFEKIGGQWIFGGASNFSNLLAPWASGSRSLMLRAALIYHYYATLRPRQRTTRTKWRHYTFRYYTVSLDPLGPLWTYDDDSTLANFLVFHFFTNFLNRSFAFAGLRLSNWSSFCTEKHTNSRAIITINQNSNTFDVYSTEVHYKRFFSVTITWVLSYSYIYFTKTFSNLTEYKTLCYYYQPFQRDSCDILTKNNILLVPNL